MNLVMGLRVVGGLMVLASIIWACVIGYYPSNVPALLVLAFGGAAVFFVGETMKDRTQK